jgi:hypothetical protein
VWLCCSSTNHQTHYQPTNQPTNPNPATSVDACEFVSGEHTPRNILIRAVRLRSPVSNAQRARLWREYVGLKAALGVTPRLEELLAEAGRLEGLTGPEGPAAGGQRRRQGGRGKR